MRTQGSPSPDESHRRRAHAFFGAPAFLLPWLDPRVILLAALWAAFLNAFFLPSTALGASWRRPSEGWTGGLVVYPLTVAVLALLFRHTPYALAAGWTAMAFGDPAAAFWGRRHPVRPWRWNPVKSWGGSLAFFLCAAGAIFLVGCRHGFGPLRSIALAVLLASVGAIIESSSGRLDDNLTVGVGVGALAWLLVGVVG